MSRLIHTIERSVEENPEAGDKLLLLAIGALSFVLFVLPL